MLKMQRQRQECRKNTKGFCICCCSRISLCVSSSTEESVSLSLPQPISKLSHYLVQEKLSQMIKKSEEERAARVMEARKGKKKKTLNDSSSSSSRSSGSKSNRRLVMMVAMEKWTRDPRGEFMQSMVEVILRNRIVKTKELRYVLNCYLEMNSHECRGVILEAFHQVCTDIFLCCK